MQYQLEPLAHAHQQAVIDIFNHFVTESFAAYPDKPVPYGFFDKLLEAIQGYPAVAVRGDGGQIVGFGFLRPYHPAPAFRRTALITYFLLPTSTGKGIGTAILQWLSTQASQQGIECLLASISSRNEQSLAFHRKQGFEECGRFRGIGTKFGEEFDEVWMQKRVAQEASEAA
ncbi:MAG: N-acetyltransferase family protein [Thermoguttaceae bacterium]